MASYTEYMIGPTANTLFSLNRMGLAEPDQVLYTPYSVMTTRWDYTRVGDGYASITWVYDVISAARLAIFMSFLNGADYVSLYVVSDKRTGRVAVPDYKLFSAVMWAPALAGQEGTPVARSNYTYQTVKLQFMNAAEIGGGLY